jgi:hypothetical protein
MLKGLRIRRSQVSLMLLVLIAAAVIVSMAKLRTRDTALRVIGHEWERSIDVQTFTGDRWIVTRVEQNRGTSALDEITWPDPKLKRRGRCEGCERQGARSAVYTVRFLDPIAERGYACEFGEGKWASFEVDSRWHAEFDPQTGAPDCETLSPAD